MFRFESLTYLYSLVILAVVAWILWYFARYRRRVIEQLGGIALVDKWWTRPSPKIERRKLVLLLSGLLLCILSLTNPQWGSKREKVKTKSADVMIVLDISTSMLAQDISPNRMERAKKFAVDLSQALQGNRIGLVFFAGGAFVQMPLTNDFAAANLFISAANPDLITTQGSVVSDALIRAHDAFDQESQAQRCIVLITDAESHDDDPASIAKGLAEEGIITFVVGVGTNQGGPIPLLTRDGSTYKKDEAGDVIISKLNPAIMEAIAEAGKGRSYTLTQASYPTSTIATAINRLAKNEVTQLTFSEYNSYFQWLLMPGIILLLAAFYMDQFNIISQKENHGNHAI